ncbi:MAG: VOC family protein [Gammaproteobacteria bacterium]|nr:VOC family protein [Pseudomonadales bacterium]MCP5348129.1 VOC family protein [Pseudomonadales bacterium]
MKNITPFLWFNDNAEQAVAFYSGIFPNSEITHTSYNDAAGPGAPGSVLTIGFTLNGNELTALNGGPAFQFSEAISLVVQCDDQDEIDHYWDRLLEGGTPMACGWLKDKFGVAWQIVPTRFFDMITSDDKARNARVLAAMNTMTKFDIAGLEAAYRGDA